MQRRLLEFYVKRVKRPDGTWTTTIEAVPVSQPQDKGKLNGQG
jgi:hypothetical protein